MIHLLLDEIYSVDITGARIKKSFGTALKFASIEELKTSLALGIATVALFFLATPAVSDFAHALGSRQTYASLHERFLPKDRWFNIPYRRWKAHLNRTAAAPTTHRPPAASAVANRSDGGRRVTATAAVVIGQSMIPKSGSRFSERSCSKPSA